VQEILVLDSTRVVAEMLRRTPEGGWPGEPVALFEGEMVFSSIGFGVPLAELYGPIGFAETG
jgi:hypothetical protein